MGALLKLEIVNYKTIRKLQADLSGFDVVIFEGDNGVGKSSIVNGILENCMAKTISDHPLTQGEIEGEKKIVITDSEGKEITIVHNFSKDNPTGTFWAMKDNKPIRNVTEIRALLGEVNNLTVDELFQMCKTTEGRRKFIKKYLYQGLSETMLKELDDIEDQIKPRTGTLTIQRAQKKSEFDTYDSIIKNSLTDEENQLIEKSEQMQKASLTKEVALNELSADIKTIEQAIIKVNEIKLLDIKNNDLLNSIKILADSIADERARLKTIFDEADGYFTVKIKPAMMKLNTAIIKNEQLKTTKEKYNTCSGELDSLNKRMDKLAERKEEILRNTKVPEGVRILSESEFTIDGLDFAQADISESKAWMLLAELSIKQFSAKYMRMGSAALYNREKLNKLAQLANEYGKIIALERVIDNLKDIKIVGTVVDDMTEHEILAYFQPISDTIISEEVNTPTKEEKPQETKIKSNKNNSTEPEEINLFE